jgi:ferredoxin-nitrite reductase
MNQPFTEEQKQYLQGFFTGLLQSGAAPHMEGMSNGHMATPLHETGKPLSATPKVPDTLYGTPLDKLCREEKIKLERNPLDMWDQIADLAAQDAFAEGADIFRLKFHGLFNCHPTQAGYMLRCRIPGCILTAAQLEGLASIAEQYGGGYAHVTTRGNIQIREIKPHHTLNTLMMLYDLGLTSRGAGADNIRNITSSPIAGVDQQEIYDTRPLARALHHYILNNRDLYGLPRKFNVAFDGGGAISIMADTNDIGFHARRVTAMSPFEPGVYFHPQLGGVAGHGYFGHDAAILLRPEQTTAFAAAVLRVFAEHGNRSNRKRARLVYVVEKLGMAAFLAKVQEKLAFKLVPCHDADLEPRGRIDRYAHIGFHPQKQAGLFYVGVAMLVGRMSVHQMQRLAAIARTFGDRTIRLTIWQNVILTGIPATRIDAVKQALREIDYDYETTQVTSGLVACTGNTGCKLSQTDTKGEAAAIARHLRQTVDLDQPLAIVLTGCPNSCAQHVCADIGLLGIKTKIGETSIDAYNISLGGGTDHHQGLAREVLKAVPHEQVPYVLERILTQYQAQRNGVETFLDFVRRHEPEALKKMVGGECA